MQLLRNHSTLFDAVLELPRLAELTGRGITPVVEIDGDACVVRHYRRGGYVAGALGDRYLRLAGNRVLNEAHASESARGRGVATPAVRFGAWYDDGIFRRYDIATSFIPDARDLADILFDDGMRDHAVMHTEKLLRDMMQQGLLHQDLNLKNILITAGGAYVLDLDRARVVDALSASEKSAMRNRFLRSLAKWEIRLGRTLPPSIHTRLDEAFVG